LGLAVKVTLVTAQVKLPLLTRLAVGVVLSWLMLVLAMLEQPLLLTTVTE
jgi:hypothetical protein